MVKSDISECTGLDPSWTHLTTTSTFPLVTGTILVVACDTGYMNIGNSTATCDRNTSYLYVHEPECKPGRFYFDHIMHQRIYHSIKPFFNPSQFTIIIFFIIQS